MHRGTDITAPVSTRTKRRLAISAVLVFCAFIAHLVLIRMGGTVGGVAEWLPVVAITAVLAWSAMNVARNAPGAWGRPVPTIVLHRITPARAVALNGMLAGMAVLLSLIGTRMPGLGWLAYWLGGFPIMLAVSLERRWGGLAYLAAGLVLAELLTPHLGLVFVLFTGLLGLVSGAAAASRRSWAATWLLCTAAEIPALAVLVTLVPGFHVFWFRPNPHVLDGIVYLVVAAGVLGLSWTLSAMLLYRPVVRAVRQRLAGA